jgi:glycolate oxidase
VREIFRATLDMGGTMSGEHGVGLSKSSYIPLELSREQIATMKAIKQALDPKNILNPGKIFPEQTNGPVSASAQNQKLTTNN